MKIHKATLGLSFALFAFFLSCTQDETAEQFADTQYRVDVYDAKKYDFPDVIKDVTYLELASDGPIIADAKQVVLTSDFIFIVDDVSNSLLKYSTSGEFLQSLEGNPEGPGNVAEITWISIDSTAKIIYVYSEPEGKLASYDYDLRYIDHLPKTIFCHSIEHLEKDKFVAFSNDTRQSGLSHYFTILDWSGNIVNEMIPLDERFERISYDMDRYLNRGTKCLYSFLNLRYDVYCISTHDAEIAYSIDLGTAKLNPDDINGKFISDIIPIIKNGNKFFINSLLESEDYSYIELSNFANTIQVWINKKSGTSKVVSGFSSLTELIGTPVGNLDNNKFVGIIPSEIAPSLAQFLDSGQIDSLNPVLSSWATSENPGALLTIFQPK